MIDAVTNARRLQGSLSTRKRRSLYRYFARVLSDCCVSAREGDAQQLCLEAQKRLPKGSMDGGEC